MGREPTPLQAYGVQRHSRVELRVKVAFLPDAMGWQEVPMRVELEFRAKALRNGTLMAAILWSNRVLGDGQLATTGLERLDLGRPPRCRGRWSVVWCHLWDAGTHRPELHPLVNGHTGTAKQLSEERLAPKRA
jgi:hypothetical protein